MPLHPEVEKLLAEFEAADLPLVNEVPPAIARRQMADLAPPVDLDHSARRIEDRTLAGPGGEIPLRVYQPPGEGPFPVVVFCHGGGWVVGDLHTHNALCNMLSSICRSIVVAVDYRLAPENRYPAAAEDAYAALCWAAENAAEIGGRPGKIVVVGDSAGGNLVTVATLMARDRGGPPVAGQVLVYPVIDCDFETSSYRTYAEGYMLTRSVMQWFWEQYTPKLERARETYVAPLHAASLENLPPALVITAEYDTLRDEGEAYARRLEEAGCRVQLTRYDGMIHGFFRMPHRLSTARQAIDEVAAFMRHLESE